MLLDNDVESVIKNMREILPNKEYYALTILSENADVITASVVSHFVGSVNLIEKRKPSIIIAENVFNAWIENGEGCVVVNDIVDLSIYLLVGGHCVISKDIAEQYLPFFIKKDMCVFNEIGFKSLSCFPKTAFNKAPTPKIRMDAIKRENHKCFICGRSPSNYTDIELHVHHLKPFRDGGLTILDNLITLCNVCHKGLEPHYDQQLVNTVNTKRNQTALSCNKFIDGIIRYRQFVITNIFKNNNTSKHGEKKCNEWSNKKQQQ